MKEKVEIQPAEKPFIWNQDSVRQHLITLRKKLYEKIIDSKISAEASDKVKSNLEELEKLLVLADRAHLKKNWIQESNPSHQILKKIFDLRISTEYLINDGKISKTEKTFKYIEEFNPFGKKIK